MAAHPLDNLSVGEINLARKIILEGYTNFVVDFRQIYLAEPPKAQLQPFLDAEHQGTLTSDTPCPPRQARCQFDVIGKSMIPEFHEALIDLELKRIVESEVVDTKHHAALTL